MTSRVVGLMLVVAVAMAVLGACNFREGDASEYGALAGPERNFLN
ncbi:MAG TPA: hypothetical protein VHH15_14230 [Actinophytocola sp.]|nr:hypothetical protein [Actinophytocola sp.]